MGRSFAHRRTFATKHALLRVIPTVTNYSATVSDISSGSIYIYYSDILIWHSTWHLFWHPIWHPFWYLFWYFLWHSIWHLSWHSFFWHSFWHLFWHSLWHGHCDLPLTVDVRQCPLRSGARGSCLAVPIEIWSWRLRSGSAYWDLNLEGWGGGRGGGSNSDEN